MEVELLKKSDTSWDETYDWGDFTDVEYLGIDYGTYGIGLDLGSSGGVSVTGYFSAASTDDPVPPACRVFVCTEQSASSRLASQPSPPGPLYPCISQQDGSDQGAKVADRNVDGRRNECEHLLLTHSGYSMDARRDLGVLDRDVVSYDDPQYH